MIILEFLNQENDPLYSEVAIFGARSIFDALSDESLNEVTRPFIA